MRNKFMRYTPLMASLGLIVLSLCGCVPVFFGAATTATTTAGEERGLGGAFSDSSIRTQITLKWTAQNPRLLPLVEVTVREGRVLLSGTVDTSEQQIDAIRLIWEVAGVKEVIDKMEVGGGTGMWGYLGDSWITTKMRSNMLAHKHIHSVNYTVKTVKGTLYLMGIALSKKELEIVIDVARNITGVQKVVSYVRIKEQFMSGNTQTLGERQDFSSASPDSLDSSAGTPEAVGVETLDGPNTTSSFDGI